MKPTMEFLYDSIYIFILSYFLEDIWHISINLFNYTLISDSSKLSIRLKSRFKISFFVFLDFFPFFLDFGLKIETGMA